MSSDPPLDKRRHPSGRPLHQSKWGVDSKPRIPRETYLTPSLRERQLQDAIGFGHRWVSKREQDQDE